MQKGTKTELLDLNKLILFLLPSRLRAWPRRFWPFRAKNQFSQCKPNDSVNVSAIVSPTIVLLTFKS